MSRFIFVTLVSLVIVAVGALPGWAQWGESIQPLLAMYCADCHGSDLQNADLRLDQLEGYAPADERLWARVYQAIGRGKMPPNDALQLSVSDRRTLLNWIARQAAQHPAAPVSRRLNRRELSAALQDLTGLPIDYAAALPADGRVNGFDTGQLRLQDAADSVSLWLDVTRRVVDSIRFLDTKQTDSSFAIDFRNHEFNDFRKFLEKQLENDTIFTKSKRLQSRQDVGLYLKTEWSGSRERSFIALPAPDDKRATVRIKLQVVAKRRLPGLPVPTLWVKVGGKYLDYVPIADTPQTLTYAVRMEDHLVEDGVIKIVLRSMVEVPYAVEGFENDDRSKPDDNIPGGIGVYRPKFDRKKLRTPDEQPVPAIVVEKLEIDYDFQPNWPPESWRVENLMVQDDDQSAKRLLALWLDRAWRRPVSQWERARFFAFYKQLRDQQLGFDEALRAAFQAVLMGGPFRFMMSPADDDPALAQHAIASRLSFMLNGRPPDRTLRQLARAGRLRESDVLNEQVDRLLDDPRRGAFVRPFVTQWLKMDQPITLTMSHFKKQDFRFGRYLKASMREETIQYIERMIAENRPARELIDSDWTMMNDILSVHYGSQPIDGARLRKVTLSSAMADPRGGGILSHAGIQSMLCWMGDNWVIYRGAWTLDRILDDPLPPPPLDVPELDPTEDHHQGNSFRELLLQHQADRRCAVCHRKMDPLGFAFQNFDLSGRWRDVEHERYYRYELDGKIAWRGEGATRPVDTKGRLPHGEKFDDYFEFKRQLQHNYLDDIVRGLLKKLTLYGTGRRANLQDLITIQAILDSQSASDYKMRDLIKSLIRSPIFLETNSSQ